MTLRGKGIGMAKKERIEIKIPLRVDVLKRLDWVAANYLCTTRHEVIEMMCSPNDDVSLTAFHAFHQSWMFYGGEEVPNIDLESVVAEGITEAKIWMAQEVICQYLKTRFGTESQRLQKIVHSINSLSVLIRISERIFSVNQLDEVEAIILSDDVRKEMTIEEMFKADVQEQRLNEMLENTEHDRASSIEAANIEMIQNIISQQLNARFGAESQHLQEKVRTICNIDVLRWIMKRVFTIDKLDVVALIIQD